MQQVDQETGDPKGLLCEYSRLFCFGTIAMQIASSMLLFCLLIRLLFGVGPLSYH